MKIICENKQSRQRHTGAYLRGVAISILYREEGVDNAKKVSSPVEGRLIADLITIGGNHALERDQKVLK